MALVLHVPHASNFIPPEDQGDFVVPRDIIEYEKLRLVDHSTDELYLKGDANNAVVAPVCRLVVDMERFPDDTMESASSVGMGATYAKTTKGEELRVLTSERRKELMDKYYFPHHEKLDNITTAMLEKHGRCIVLDCHSFPVEPLPTQTSFLDPPEICIGTDDFHTSPELSDLVVTHFQMSGYQVLINKPFAGSLVPNKFYGRDNRVQSIMVELRRNLYMDESTGERIEAGFRKLQEVLTSLRAKLNQFSLDWNPPTEP